MEEKTWFCGKEIEKAWRLFTSGRIGVQKRHLSENDCKAFALFYAERVKGTPLEGCKSGMPETFKPGGVIKGHTQWQALERPTIRISLAELKEIIKNKIDEYKVPGQNIEL